MKLTAERGDHSRRLTSTMCRILLYMETYLLLFHFLMFLYCPKLNRTINNEFVFSGNYLHKFSIFLTSCQGLLLLTAGGMLDSVIKMPFSRSSSPQSSSRPLSNGYVVHQFLFSSCSSLLDLLFSKLCIRDIILLYII